MSWESGSPLTKEKKLDSDGSLPSKHCAAGYGDQLSTSEGKILLVDLASWIIQDGNYDDFELGKETECALEFRSIDLWPVEGGALFAEHVKASRYRIRARVAFSAPGVWVLDAGGFVAFEQSEPPPQALSGSFVEGIVELGIDPCFYSADLSRLVGMPLLSSSWVVRELQRETTPWVEVRDRSGRVRRVRDPVLKSFVSVARTDGWNDDDGHANYILALERVVL